MSNQMLTDFLIQYQLQLSIEWDKGGGGHCSLENVIHEFPNNHNYRKQQLVSFIVWNFHQLLNIFKQFLDVLILVAKISFVGNLPKKILQISYYQNK